MLETLVYKLLGLGSGGSYPSAAKHRQAREPAELAVLLLTINIDIHIILIIILILILIMTILVYCTITVILAT